MRLQGGQTVLPFSTFSLPSLCPLLTMLASLLGGATGEAEAEECVGPAEFCFPKAKPTIGWDVQKRPRPGACEGSAGLLLD